MQNPIKSWLSDLFFPKTCFSCQIEGDYLCPDCRATLEISSSHQKYSSPNLDDLYFPLSYQNPLIKRLIQKFKYEPFVKELAKSLSLLIIEHFQLIDNKPDFSGFILVPVPLARKRLKWRGFNQTEEIGKALSSFLKIPLISGCLIKIREAPPQVELSDEERKENVKGVFACQKPAEIRGRKILLIDDVYTTGATMEEASRVLKKAGAKKIIGIVVARG